MDAAPVGGFGSLYIECLKHSYTAMLIKCLFTLFDISLHHSFTLLINFFFDKENNIVSNSFDNGSML